MQYCKKIVQQAMMSKIPTFYIKTGSHLALARPCFPPLILILARDWERVTAFLFKDFVINTYQKKEAIKK